MKNSHCSGRASVLCFPRNTRRVAHITSCLGQTKKERKTMTRWTKQFSCCRWIHHNDSRFMTWAILPMNTKNRSTDNLFTSQVAIETMPYMYALDLKFITRIGMVNMSKRQQPHLEENFSPKPTIGLQWTARKPSHHRAGCSWSHTSLYTDTSK